MKFYLTTARLIILISIIALSACTKSTLTETEARKQIMELHELQRKYHFEKMVDEFVGLLSPSHISVNRGEIKSLTKEEHTNRFKNYFDSVEFEKWDDVNPPIIKFSEDLSLAYTIVDKEVVVNYQDENGKMLKDLTKFSWVAIYKRYEDGWKIDCVASTNKPSEIINN